MKPLAESTLAELRFDFDRRETLLREVVEDRLGASPPPAMDDFVVASYFLALRSSTLDEAVKEFAYHATSGTKNPPPGSLLAQCTAVPAGIDPFDSERKTGLLHMAFPLKMMLHPDGHVTSCDLLHTVAGAIMFDVYENIDTRLVSLTLPEHVIRSFPGPAYGPAGVRKLAGFPAEVPAFGTILKPTAGVTALEVGKLVEDAAQCDLFLFIKEDENLYPNLGYSRVADRVRLATEAIARASSKRGDRGLIFAPHISGAPHEILETASAALEAGATGLMFSETFAGGVVRMVREATRYRPQPPALYGHNAGIGVKTRCVWREVIDLLARLDGIDFRQTAPARPGPPFIRPYGAEWCASERALTGPLPGIKPTMIARAGALDQGNLGLNLEQAEAQGILGGILFLAGSAINSIKNDQGRADSRIGATAMRQALEAHREGHGRELPAEKRVEALADLAKNRGWRELSAALSQRYGGH